MLENMTESIVYNMYDQECKERFSDAEIRQAVELYMDKKPKRMLRPCLLNIVRYYREENSRLKEENSRLQRQVDILMGHDVR